MLHFFSFINYFFSHPFQSQAKNVIIMLLAFISQNVILSLICTFSFFYNDECYLKMRKPLVLKKVYDKCFLCIFKVCLEMFCYKMHFIGVLKLSAHDRTSTQLINHN